MKNSHYKHGILNQSPIFLPLLPNWIFIHNIVIRFKYYHFENHFISGYFTRSKNALYFHWSYASKCKKFIMDYRDSILIIVIFEDECRRPSYLFIFWHAFLVIPTLMMRDCNIFNTFNQRIKKDKMIFTLLIHVDVIHYS